MPVDIEKLNNLHSDGAMLRDVDFNIFGEIPSLPVDLDVSSPVLGLTFCTKKLSRAVTWTEGTICEVKILSCIC